jgi:hypothetical protein
VQEEELLAILWYIRFIAKVSSPYCPADRCTRRDAYGECRGNDFKRMLSHSLSCIIKKPCRGTALLFCNAPRPGNLVCCIG